MENLDAAVAVTGEAIAIAGANEPLEQLQIAAEAEHAGRAAAEHEITQRHLAPPEVLDDQPLPGLEIAQHRGRKARAAVRPHQSPQHRVVGLIKSVQLGEFEQLAIDAKML